MTQVSMDTGHATLTLRTGAEARPKPIAGQTRSDRHTEQGLSRHRASSLSPLQLTARH